MFERVFGFQSHVFLLDFSEFIGQNFSFVIIIREIIYRDRLLSVCIMT